MELRELLEDLRGKMDPLEYTAVMRKYFGDAREDWQKLQMIGIDEYVILADEELADYLAARGMEKVHGEIYVGSNSSEQLLSVLADLAAEICALREEVKHLNDTVYEFKRQYVINNRYGSSDVGVFDTLRYP